MSLEKWKKCNVSSESGRMYNAYTYYLDRDRIIDFSKNSMRFDGLTTFENGHMSHDVLGMGVFMHFPTPFNVGDIVRIDCTPFGDVGYAIVLEKAGAKGHTHGLHIPVLYFNGRWNINMLDFKWGSGD